MTTWTPAAGHTPKTTPGASRGYLTTGVTHAVAASAVKIGVTATTVCGRKVVATATWSPEDWPRFRATWDRMGKTHVTGTCGRCAKAAR